MIFLRILTWTFWGGKDNPELFNPRQKIPDRILNRSVQYRGGQNRDSISRIGCQRQRCRWRSDPGPGSRVRPPHTGQCNRPLFNRYTPGGKLAIRWTQAACRSRTASAETNRSSAGNCPISCSFTFRQRGPGLPGRSFMWMAVWGPCGFLNNPPWKKSGFRMEGSAGTMRLFAASETGRGCISQGACAKGA